MHAHMRINIKKYLGRKQNMSFDALKLKIYVVKTVLYHNFFNDSTFYDVAFVMYRTTAGNM